jgi:hypothetical protein
MACGIRISRSADYGFTGADFDVSLTGFESPEIDALFKDVQRAMFKTMILMWFGAKEPRSLK